MNALQLERVQAHLLRLRLFKRLEALLQKAADQEMSYADFLEQILNEEVVVKTAKNITMRTHMARFPFVKSLEIFDFGYQPSLDKKQVQQLSTCHFIEHSENLVILGLPGVGKTHLSVGLGLKAIERGYRVLLSSEGRLEEKLKTYLVPPLLIIDEMGYLPIERGGPICFSS